jgi:hypothetical protein
MISGYVSYAMTSTTPRGDSIDQGTLDPPGPALTVCEVCTLPDLDNISVRIADVAARLAVLGDRLSDELRSSTFP